ncbi:nucleobase-ascorbate transporter 6-like isoform X2 [Populus alba]|uniref:nucleobase-ascorbate transporter 6-like isoform X2 n=1 Tax=Populus alba TaxID=43335 RepID=UPI003CC70A2A
MGVPLLCLLLYSAVVLDGCENAGLLGLTRVGSQRVVQISAGFMLFFSVLRRFRTVLASHTIANCGSSLLCHLCLCGFCWSGISPVLQLNSFRTKFILGFSLFLGLPVPQYFKDYILVSDRGPVHTGATW